MCSFVNETLEYTIHRYHAHAFLANMFIKCGNSAFKAIHRNAQSDHAGPGIVIAVQSTWNTCVCTAYIIVRIYANECW